MAIEDLPFTVGFIPIKFVSIRFYQNYNKELGFNTWKDWRNSLVLHNNEGFDKGLYILVPPDAVVSDNRPLERVLGQDKGQFESVVVHSSILEDMINKGAKVIILKYNPPLIGDGITIYIPGKDKREFRVTNKMELVPCWTLRKYWAIALMYLRNLFRNFSFGSHS